MTSLAEPGTIYPGEPQVMDFPLDHHRPVKFAYTTRGFVDLFRPPGTLRLLRDGTPQAGDVVLARVDAIGHHSWLERPDGRRAAVFAGDEIVVAYGARYATDQFEAEVPGDLGPCHLVAGGGLAGRVIAAHASLGPATRITPLGLLTDPDGAVVNLRSAATVALRADAVAGHPPVIVVVGTSMNSGKTTSAASLVRGLRRAGRRVGAAKATGTGAGNDRWHLIDSGAAVVLDFTDAGFGSTYQVPHDDLVATYFGLLAALTESGADVAVVEIADGVAHLETARLLQDAAVQASIGHVVFSSADALGALCGVDLLRSWGLRVAAVSGVMTASPLAQREASALLDVPVVATAELVDPIVAAALMPTRAGSV